MQMDNTEQPAGANDGMEDIIGFEALYESMLKCKNGVMWKDSTAHYVLNGIEETLKLKKQLHDGTYKARPMRAFKVTYPKEREIRSISFRDRVYLRSLNDNELYPKMTRSFIRDNCACQKGRGTDDARNRLKCHMRREFNRTGLESSVLQCDAEQYYKSMRLDVTSKQFCRKIRPEARDPACTALKEQCDGEAGFYPGSQTIQIAGISQLDGVDHFIKEKLHIKGYIRYMDDFILIHPNPEYLEYCKEQIEAELAKLGLHLHPKKTRIYPITEGITFLGFTFKLTETGKVLMLLKSSNVKAERRKLKRMVNLCQKGVLPRSKVDECYRSWKAHAEKGNTYKLLQRMDAYYESLWR